VFVTDVVSPQVESIGKLLPGLNLRVLFCNTGLTYEDGMVLSNSAALRFQYTAEHSITLSLFQTRGMFIDGTVQAGSQPWWQFPYDGVITTLEPTRLGKVRLVLTVKALPCNGDKFTTYHGQKGVVTIVDDELMPVVEGKAVEIIIGSSSVVKRGTPSQLLEAALSQYVLDNMLTVDKPYTQTQALIHAAREFKSSDTRKLCEKLMSHYCCKLFVQQTEIKRRGYTRNSMIPHMETVMCNYGTIRVMQSVFTASSRLSYTSVPSSSGSKRIQGGQRTGGGNTLGEMEFMQLEASGLGACMQEFVNRSDMCIVDVCICCNKISMLCTCSVGQKLYEARIRYSTIRYVVGMAVIGRSDVELYPSPN
jgi:hypothetical protein